MVFVTTTVYKWQPVLTQRNIVDIITNELRNIRGIYHVSVISYVVMPSHIHALLGFRNIANLSRCIQGFKSVTSRQIKPIELPELADNGFRLWRPRFDDLIIHSKPQLRIKMEYIHNNPVKAGLVDKAEDWPYSSAVDWLTTRSGLVEIDKDYHWLRD